MMGSAGVIGRLVMERMADGTGVWYFIEPEYTKRGNALEGRRCKFGLVFNYRGFQ
jgi:hypothetical protein